LALGQHELLHRGPVAAAKIVSVTLQQFTATAESVSSEQNLDSEVVRESILGFQLYIVVAILKDIGIFKAVGRGRFQLLSKIATEVDSVDREEAE
jgi:hypothetical protein